jgi:hypothetical protein
MPITNGTVEFTWPSSYNDNRPGAKVSLSFTFDEGTPEAQHEHIIARVGDLARSEATRLQTGEVKKASRKPPASEVIIGAPAIPLGAAPAAAVSSSASVVPNQIVAQLATAPVSSVSVAPVVSAEIIPMIAAPASTTLAVTQPNPAAIASTPAASAVITDVAALAVSDPAPVAEITDTMLMESVTHKVAQLKVAFEAKGLDGAGGAAMTRQLAAEYVPPPNKIYLVTDQAKRREFLDRLNALAV